MNVETVQEKHVLSIIYDYSFKVPDKNRTEILKGTMLKIEPLEGFIYSIVTYNTEKDKLVGHTQKGYYRTYITTLKSVVLKVTGVVRGFVMY